MSKSLQKYNEDNIPYILKIFENEVLNKTSSEKLLKLEKKFGVRDDEDIIPSEIKKLFFK